MVILSRRTRYAVHGVAYIAAFSRGRSLPFDEILEYLRIYSRQLTLSPGYLAKLFHALSRAGLVRAVPGARGGYSLARPAAAIRLIEIVEALEGPLLSGCCLNSGSPCPMQSSCGVSDVLEEAERSFRRFLEKNTLAGLVRRMSFPTLPRRRHAGDRRLPGRSRRTARSPIPAAR